MGNLRVMVVEDSLTIRKHLVEVLERDPQIDVVAEARDGQEAIAKCQALRPDVVTLDIVLPRLNGLEVTEHIMAYYPTPILVVSSASNRGELFDTFDALTAGAVDVLDKPTGYEIEDRWEQQFLRKVRMAARIRVIMHPRAKLRAFVPPPLPVPVRPADTGGCRVVAIGASTGGPGTLANIVRDLPDTFPLPILLVLHMDAAFAPSFVEWLDKLTPLPVGMARHGMPVPDKGGILMAPPGHHLVVKGDQLQLTDQPPDLPFRPAADVLFASLAREMGPKAVGILLTGMGRDGAQGLLSLRQAGGMTVAQDERSSVVFGMPKAAIELGAAREILAADQVARWLQALAPGKTSRRRSA